MSDTVSEREWVSALVADAVARIPFYRDHLADAPTDSLAELPTFDKHTTAGYGRFPLSAGGARGAHRVIATSGTSGDRLCMAFDRGDWERTGAWLARAARHGRLGPDDVLLNTHCYGLWVGGPALDLLAQSVAAGLMPLGPCAPEVVLRFLADGVGTAISATPSYLRRLVETAEASGADLAGSGLRVGFIGAEPAEQSLRRKLLAALPPSFRWVELYGLTETTGPSVAFGPDPEADELVLNAGDFRAEVLARDSDAHVPVGEVGELTLTTRRVGCRSPLIRYRTRDLVRATVGDPSDVERISRILGRADDALKVGGVLVYPTSVAEIVSEILPPSAEWRAVLRRGDPDDELLIEAEADAEACAAVADAFRTRVGLGVEVVPAGELARSREKTRRILVDATRLAASP